MALKRWNPLLGSEPRCLSLAHLHTDVIYHHYLWPFLYWTVPEPALNRSAPTAPVYSKRMQIWRFLKHCQIKCCVQMLVYPQWLEVTLSPQVSSSEGVDVRKYAYTANYTGRIGWFTYGSGSGSFMDVFWGIFPLFDSDGRDTDMKLQGERGACNNESSLGRWGFNIQLPDRSWYQFLE